MSGITHYLSLAQRLRRAQAASRGPTARIRSVALELAEHGLDDLGGLFWLIFRLATILVGTRRSPIVPRLSLLASAATSGVASRGRGS